MGTLAGSGRPVAFQNQIHPNGLDLGRSIINAAPGMWQAAEAASFRAGMCVMLDSNDKIVASDGTAFLGFTKWNKATTLYATVTDEPIVLVGTSAINLAHAAVSRLRVNSAVDNGGTTYTITTHYTVSEANGTVTRVVVGGGPADGDTVYVSYTYELTSSMLQFQGRNFWNFLDEVSIHDNFTTVITDAEMLFTTQFDTTAEYVRRATVYCSGSQVGQTEGEITSLSTGALICGEVLFPPTASDPFLGIRPVKGSRAV